MFAAEYSRQLRQSLDGIEISPSRSQRYKVALEISKQSQISLVENDGRDLPRAGRQPFSFFFTSLLLKRMSDSRLSYTLSGRFTYAGLSAGAR
jgi:hypothetical protein